MTWALQFYFVCFLKDMTPEAQMTKENRLPQNLKPLCYKLYHQKREKIHMMGENICKSYI